MHAAKSHVCGAPQDCNGHGTHVAASVAGLTYGVAKNASLLAVRALECLGNGTVSQVGGPAVRRDCFGSVKVWPCAEKKYRGSSRGCKQLAILTGQCLEIWSGVSIVIQSPTKHPLWSSLHQCPFSKSQFPGQVCASRA